MRNVVEITHAFVERINQHDVAALTKLMTSNHRLIDPGGAVVAGIAQVGAAWQGYFAMVPDYRITVEQTLTHANTVMLVGQAGGTYAPDGQASPGRRWQVPAAWRVVVRKGCVAEWQVYADNEPLRCIMERERQQGFEAKGG